MRHVPTDPAPSLVVSATAPFEGETSYNTEFKQKPLPPESLRVTSPRPPASMPFEGESTYRGHFTERPASARPAPPAPKSPGRSGPRQPRPSMEGESTYRSHFVPKGTGRPDQVTRLASAPTLGQVFPGSSPFEGVSTYKDNFVEKPHHAVHPPPAFAPRPKIPFDATTVYNEQFKAKPLPEKPTPRLADRGASPGVLGAKPRFQGESSYRSQFYEKPLAPADRAMVKTHRDSQVLQTSGDSGKNWATSYGDQFPRKDLGVCPVTLMSVYPARSPTGREHTFWNDKHGAWI